MREFYAITVALIGLLLANPAASADAETLYRWTDAFGRTHFSDRPPSAATPPQVERLPTPSYVDSGVPADHYSVTNQLQRMQAERLQRERELQERQREAREQALREREIAAAERAAEQAANADRGGGVYLSPYGHRRPYPDRPHRRHPHRPVKPPSLWEPDHPAYRPYPRHRPPRPRPSGSVSGL